MKFTIDVETTGKNHRIHEMIQICILPVDENLEGIIEDVFYVQIKAKNLEVMDPKALEINRLDPKEGVSREDALESFHFWFKEMTKKYQFSIITPIGQNYSFDKEFIINFVGFEFYEKNFSRTFRDTKVNAGLFQDAGILKIKKTGLSDQAKYFNIENSNHHDALNDCIVTTKTYKKHVEMISLT